MSLPLFQVTGQPGYFTDYTFDSGLIDYTGITHSYHSYRDVFFNSIDTRTIDANRHSFKVTVINMATPCVDQGYGTFAKGQVTAVSIDTSSWIVFEQDLIPTPYNAAPWSGIYQFNVLSGWLDSGFGYKVLATHFDVESITPWPTIGINDVRGGTVQHTIRIQSIDDGGGGIITSSQNAIRMIIEQN